MGGRFWERAKWMGANLVPWKLKRTAITTAALVGAWLINWAANAARVKK